jgi:hypothetical protein
MSDDCDYPCAHPKRLHKESGCRVPGCGCPRFERATYRSPIGRVVPRDTDSRAKRQARLGAGGQAR